MHKINCMHRRLVFFHLLIRTYTVSIYWCHNTYMTVSVKIVLNGTFSFTKNSIETTVVQLCWTIAMLDLQYNYSGYLAT